MCIDHFNNLVIAIADALELEIKVIHQGDKLHFRWVSLNNNKLLAEDMFDNKPAAIILTSGFAKHSLEADILVFTEPERILVTSFPILL